MLLWPSLNWILKKGWKFSKSAGEHIAVIEHLWIVWKWIYITAFTFCSASQAEQLLKLNYQGFLTFALWKFNWGIKTEWEIWGCVQVSV